MPALDVVLLRYSRDVLHDCSHTVEGVSFRELILPFIMFSKSENI